MTSKGDDDNVININFDTKNTKGTKPSEKELFADTLDAAKVAMVRGIIVGEDKNGDIKLITSIEDLEQCSLLIDEAKSFLESQNETWITDDAAPISFIKLYVALILPTPVW